jgi:DivIVA domain-containing protein
MAPLAPQDIANRRFATGGRRGYDREQVEAFLHDVARAYAETLADLQRAQSQSGMSYEQLGREAGAVLEAARQGAESLTKRAHEEVDVMRSTARDDADEIRREAEGEASEILEKAAQEAERAMREAELVARRLRNVTKRQCSEMLAEATTRQERLAAHERELRRRIADIERVFESFREELDAQDLHVIRVEEPQMEEGQEAEADSRHDDAEDLQSMPEENDTRSGLKVEPVQPRPVFESRPGR